VPACPSGEGGRPRLEVADIFRAHGEAYRRSHVLTPQQARVMRAIESCRTAALGGHLEVCDRCGFERPAYNSCRNRHCPKCQARAQEAWVTKHVGRLLPTHYFHVVFTLPEEMRGLVHRNRRLLFSLLFAAASATLLQLGQGRLGATLALTAVLHTWTRDMSFHPHLHCLVSGGGLAADGTWKPTREDYLFPHLALSRLFRGKFLAGLVRLYERGALDLGGECRPLAEPDVFQALKDRLYGKDWVVYAKPPFAGPEQVYRYLGRYTHRIAISNARLEAVDDAGVRFRTKHGKTATLRPVEFIRRFLLHVLPEGFHKIRHYGLLAAGKIDGELELARQALLATSARGPQPEPTPQDETPGGGPDTSLIDTGPCPRCAVGTMVSHPLPRVGALPRRSLPPPAPSRPPPLRLTS
jgi:hypothetical protein